MEPPGTTGAGDHVSRSRSRSRHFFVAGAVIAVAAAVAVAVAADEKQEPSLTPAPTATPVATEDSSASRRRRPRVESIRTGGGVRGAEIVRLRGGEELPGVIFLHGWGLVERSDYRPWIRHLARAGNQVIVPRYQRDEDSDPGRSLDDAVAGIRRALRRVPAARRQLVVGGHSAGGALAADYAGVARARALPQPLAVFSVYPGRRILGYPQGIPEVDPSRISSRTRILAMAGDRDTAVGRAPAQELVTDARQVGVARKRYVLVQRRSVADHYGPTRATRLARRVFWGRVDRLIAAARGQ